MIKKFNLYSIRGEYLCREVTVVGTGLAGYEARNRVGNDRVAELGAPKLLPAPHVHFGAV